MFPREQTVPFNPWGTYSDICFLDLTVQLHLSWKIFLTLYVILIELKLNKSSLEMNKCHISQTYPRTQKVTKKNICKQVLNHQVYIFNIIFYGGDYGFVMYFDRESWVGCFGLTEDFWKRWVVLDILTEVRRWLWMLWRFLTEVSGWVRNQLYKWTPPYDNSSEPSWLEHLHTWRADCWKPYKPMHYTPENSYFLFFLILALYVSYR